MFFSTSIKRLENKVLENLDSPETLQNLNFHKDSYIVTKCGCTFFAAEILNNLNNLKQLLAETFKNLSETTFYLSRKANKFPFSVCVQKKDSHIDVVLLFSRGIGSSKKSRLLYDLNSGEIIARAISREPSYNIENEIQYTLKHNRKDGAIGLPQLFSTEDIKTKRPALNLKYYFQDLEDLTSVSPLHRYRIILQIMERVINIHAKGDVHFDLKTGNMRANFDPNDPDSVEAVVIDFGRMTSRENPDLTVLKRQPTQAEVMKENRRRYKFSADMGNPLAQFEMYLNSETEKKKWSGLECQQIMDIHLQ